MTKHTITTAKVVVITEDELEEEEADEGVPRRIGGWYLLPSSSQSSWTSCATFEDIVDNLDEIGVGVGVGGATTFSHFQSSTIQYIVCCCGPVRSGPVQH